MLDFTHPCGLHGSPTSLSNTLCTCEALVQPLPSLLLVLVALAGGACALLCSTPTPPPKQLFLRSKSLHIGGIVFALFGAVAALTSVALPLLVPADWPEGDDGSMLPVAWLLSPLIEFVAACVAAVILAHTRQSRHPRARSSWRILVGVAALLQAVTTIVVMMLTVMAASSFVLILTLVRVGTNCALALTALWPNSPGSSVGSAESGGWGSPDEPSPHAREAAAALLRQVDAAAADATAHRRSQRDVWAEWLTLSSSQMSGMAQQPACTRPANVMTEGSVASTFHSRDVSRITHDSDQRDSGIHYTIGMDSASERNTDYSHAASCCPSPHASRAPTQTGGYGADRWAPVGGGCTVSPERIVKSRQSRHSHPSPSHDGDTGGGAVPIVFTAPSSSQSGASRAVPTMMAVPGAGSSGAHDGALMMRPAAAQSDAQLASGLFGAAGGGGVGGSSRGHRRVSSNPFDEPAVDDGGRQPVWPPQTLQERKPCTGSSLRDVVNGAVFTAPSLRDVAPLGSASPKASPRASDEPSRPPAGGAAGGRYDWADAHGSASTTARTSATRPTAEGLPEDPFAEHCAPSAAASVWAANGGHRASDARDASGPGDERWTEPLVEVEIVGHVWVPDLENPGKGDLHLEYMLKTVGDDSSGDSHLVQRRYRDFERLAAALALVGRRSNTTVPSLPSNLTFGRRLSAEFAVQRQAALQTWLNRVLARPPLWSDALRLFLGVNVDDAHDGAEVDAGAPDAAAGVGGGAGGAPVLAQDGRDEVLANLKWIAQRALQSGCGVPMDGRGSGGGGGGKGSSGSFRASTLVKWLATQALVTSREQAIPLGEALRAEGFITPINPADTARFADNASLYRFVEPATM